MKKIFWIFAVIMSVSPVFAEGENQQTPSIDTTSVLAAASYVQGAVEELDAAKQDTLSSSNVVESGSGAVVTSVSAENGTVTVTKGEVTIPVGGATSSTHAAIWIQ